MALFGGDATAQNDRQTERAGGDAPQADGHVVQHLGPLVVGQVLGLDAVLSVELPLGDVAAGDVRLQVAVAPTSAPELAAAVDDDVAEFGGQRDEVSVVEDDDARPDAGPPDHVHDGPAQYRELSESGGLRVVENGRGSVERPLEVGLNILADPSGQVARPGEDAMLDRPCHTGADGEDPVTFAQAAGGDGDVAERLCVVVRARREDPTCDLGAAGCIDQHTRTRAAYVGGSDNVHAKSPLR